MTFLNADKLKCTYITCMIPVVDSNCVIEEFKKKLFCSFCYTTTLHNCLLLGGSHLYRRKSDAFIMRKRVC